MQVLVTGANGFLGQWFMKRLLERLTADNVMEP